MKTQVQIRIIGAQRGIMRESTDRATGEVKPMAEPLHWATIKGLQVGDTTADAFGYREIKLPTTHAVFDQVKALFQPGKAETFTFECETKVLGGDQKGKLSLVAVGLVG